jgi:hypothetical protein
MAATNRLAFDEGQNREIVGEAMRSINVFGAIPSQIQESHRYMVNANKVLANHNHDLTNAYRHQNAEHRILLDNHEILRERAAALDNQL